MNRLAAGGGVVVITGANALDNQRMADAQLASALSELTPILYVDPAWSLLGRLRKEGFRRGLRRQSRLARVNPRLFRLTPEALPGSSRPLIAKLNRVVVAIQIRATLRRLKTECLAHVEANTVSPTLGLVPTKSLVYWAQDDFVGMAPLVGIPPSVFERSTRQLAERADIIIAANPVVAESLRKSRGAVHLIPFGCDVELFASSAHAEPATDVTLKPPIAMLMGTINERLDLDILRRLAQAGCSLLLVGPAGDRFRSAAFEALVSAPDVQWVGARDFQQLPSYLAHAAVGIVPYTHSRFNEGSFPLKTLEYLAAGLSVVATDLPAIRWLAAPGVHVADDPEAFVSAVLRCVEAREGAETGAGDAAGRKARVEFAAQHSWSSRAQQFAEAIGLASQHVQLRN